jgi:16S rRNA (guanine527-N7)-methyltransferase
MVLAIKGAAAPREIEEAGAALRLLHASVSGTRRTPTGTIVIIRKERVTPQRYPRRPGEPQRAPLGN